MTASPSSEVQPVTVINGLSGSGKTTVLKQVISAIGGQKSTGASTKIAVLVSNEDDRIELNGVAKNVTVRKREPDLQKQLQKFLQRNKFDYLFIEETGTSEPVSVAKTLVGLQEKQLLRLDCLVTVVDAPELLACFGTQEGVQGEDEDENEDAAMESTEEGEGDAEEEEEEEYEEEEDETEVLIEQIEFSNVVVLNRFDVVTSADDRQYLVDLVHNLNTEAKVLRGVMGITPGDIMNTGLFDFDKTAHAPMWIQKAAEKQETNNNNNNNGDGGNKNISIFVYRARRPFHPQRLWTCLTHKDEEKEQDGEEQDDIWTGVIRSKGIFWLANMMNDRIEWSGAGAAFRFEIGLPWVHSENISPVDSSKHEYGDRRQEIVWIGNRAEMDTERIKATLDGCLLTDNEMNDGMIRWMKYEDPFQLSQSSGHDHHHGLGHHDRHHHDHAHSKKKQYKHHNHNHTETTSAANKNNDNNNNHDHSSNTVATTNDGPDQKKPKHTQITLQDAMKEFMDIMRALPKEDVHKFSDFASQYITEFAASKVPQKHEDPRENALSLIIQELKKVTSVSAEAPNEKFHFPKIGSFAGYNSKNTIHVDAFLYSDEDVDELAEEGLIAREYCEDCGSRNVRPLNYISHSFSPAELKFIYGESVLGDLTGKTVVDVGSRLGAVLYTGYLFSKASWLIGVEINSYFCDLQRKFIKKFRMDDRAKVIEADVFTQGEVVKNADVIVMHNVFEFFLPGKDQKSAWIKMKGLITSTRKGTLLLTSPSLQRSLSDCGLAKSEKDAEHIIKGWLQEVPLQYPVSFEDCEDGACALRNNNNNDDDDDDDEHKCEGDACNHHDDYDHVRYDFEEIHLYKVI